MLRSGVVGTRVIREMRARKCAFMNGRVVTWTFTDVCRSTVLVPASSE